jgi:hypothetical protein
MTAEEWSRIFEELIVSLSKDISDEEWKKIEDHCKLLKDIE